MNDHPILVLGGTGKAGRRVAARLHGLGLPVRVPTRSGALPFDWTDESTWPAVLARTRAVFVVPFDGLPLTRAFVARAVEAGVERVVLLSGRGVDVPGYPQISAGQTHVDGEAAVRALDVAWTVVRPTWFAQNFTEGFFRDAVAAGDLRLPAGDGAVSFVDADDIADVVVAALVEPGHAGRTYELSGPRALTLAEVAAEISAASGRHVRYTPLSVEDYTAELVATGWPEADARELAVVVTAARDGLDAYLSDGVQQALGRPARDFGEFAAAATWP
ncbi:NmrA family NAD(P)-binding protein [Actinosynnema sp. NPDC023587]|uniref:NmrA family NAD(P)-binding protein n=1 Tax=Actinosynnema sp. NPDC023587 TaxID=3154695 RepID=UPI00340B3308